MLKLTKKADYGLIAMKHLAEHAEVGSVSAKDLADAYGMPQEALAKILQKLARAGLLASQYGTKGGYTLGRDPFAISALDVIKAVEGPLFVTSCVSTKGNCEQVDRCTIKEPLRRVNQEIEAVLGRITIGEMAREDAKPELVALS